MVSSVCLFVNRSYATQSDAQRQKLRGSCFGEIDHAAILRAARP